MCYIYKHILHLKYLTDAFTQIDLHRSSRTQSEQLKTKGLAQGSSRSNLSATFC